MSSSGPRIGDPVELIPLAPFARPMGVHMPVFVAADVWEDVVRHSPYDLCGELSKAIGNALSAVGSDRADRDHISFKYWVPSETGKSRRVRLSAHAMLSEENGPWIQLKIDRQPLLHGVSAG